jgi:hypothetical protein
MSAFSRWSLLLTAALTTACRPPETVEVTPETSRGVFRGETEPEGAAAQQRFAVNMMQQMLQWTKPESWRSVRAQQFRDINFTFGPAGEGECYVTMLSAAGATVQENLNRWRGQFGLPPLAEAEFSALPQKTFLGRNSPVLDISGDYNPGAMSGGTGVKKDWRLTGLVMEAPGALITVKMTGPKALLEAEMKNFDAFLLSVLPAPRLR